MADSERVLILVSTTSYRTEDFVRAARRMGLEPIIGTNRCHELAKVWDDEAFGTLEVDLRDLEHATEQIATAARERAFSAILGTDEQTALVAASASALLGLAGNDPRAVYRARNKQEMRRALLGAKVPTPAAEVFSLDADPKKLADAWHYPVVLKPLLLSTSRGVVRADDAAGFVSAWQRIAAILATPALRASEDPAMKRILVEPFVPGAEVAVEGILSRGVFTMLALFDKPDPLDGPFFEETIYVTPSRLSSEVQASIQTATADAARAMGLVTGPIHAELRIGEDDLPQVIEVAARSIGGLCARTLRFGLEGQSLEEVVLAHALGRAHASLDVRRASGVMMIPVPRGGVFQSVEGVEEARAIAGIEDVVISAKIGEVLMPLPEGSSYLGFIFARGQTPAIVEEALRRAHAALAFSVAPTL